jgi:hypothetical protein
MRGLGSNILGNILTIGILAVVGAVIHRFFHGFTWPWLALLAVGAVLVLIGAWRWWRGRHSDDQNPRGRQPMSDQRKNVTRQKNEGGGDNININQGDNSTALIKPTVHISAPQPGLRVESEYDNQPSGDKFKSRLHLWVKDGYAANGLRVAVVGKSISDYLMVMTFDPSRPGVLTGSFQSPVRDFAPTHALFQCAGQLRPEYIVEIQTDEPESLTFEARLL